MNALASRAAQLEKRMSPVLPSPRLWVSDHWMHCFVGSQETLVRWAYEPTNDHLVGQAKSGWGWCALSASELVDLREELEDNGVLEVPEDHDDVRRDQRWPVWATPLAG